MQFPPPRVREPDPDHARTAFHQRLSLCEVLVLRDDHGGVLKREISDLRVGGGGQSPIGDVFGLAPLLGESLGERRRQLRVDEESHQATRNTG